MGAPAMQRAPSAAIFFKICAAAVRRCGGRGAAIAFASSARRKLRLGPSPSAHFALLVVTLALAACTAISDSGPSRRDVESRATATNGPSESRLLLDCIALRCSAASGPAGACIRTSARGHRPARGDRARRRGRPRGSARAPPPPTARSVDRARRHGAGDRAGTRLRCSRTRPRPVRRHADRPN